ncbi:MAG: branched-chain amino acid ABC transporter permease [Halobacteriota archaeon]
MVDSGLLAGAVISGVLIGIFYALVASGFSMIWAAMKMVNVSHAALMVLAAYLSMAFVRATGLDVFATLALMAPAMFLFGGLMYKFVLSHSYRSEDFETVSLVSTFGLAIVIENALLATWGPTQRSLPSVYGGDVTFAGLTVGRLPLISGIIALVATGILYYLIYQTGLGRAVRAAWQDETLAMLHGVNPDRVRFIVFGLATALAGIAGVLLPAMRTINPALHWEYIVIVFIIVIVGGVGSIVGTLVTGLTLGVIEEVGPLFISSSWVPVVLYTILLVFLLAKPDGIFEGVA